MFYLIILLVMSVFMGTELLAIPTPAIQMSIYRITLIICWILSIYKIYRNDYRMLIRRDQSTTYILAVFIFWWLWTLISGIWALDFINWFRATFLISLGVSSILMIYFWITTMHQWQRLVQAAWLAMTGLVFWGYYELVTNNYYFADLAKVDKHNTFASQPMTRIPVTVFENQNDFATMLLAYLIICVILIYLSNGYKRKFMYILSIVLASYLVFRSESRMILIGYFISAIILIVLNYRLDIKRPLLFKIFSIGSLTSIFLISVVPPLRNKLATMFYIGHGRALDGDTVRVNLWRNGLGFLGTTFGLGVGAGNIEVWMAHFRVLPTKIITNMHNWWLEILVAYGIPVFIMYVLMYGYLIYYLYYLRKFLDQRYVKVNNSLLAFLCVYIFASITSANNILIEWHWVFFGLIICYIKLVENELKRGIA